RPPVGAERGVPTELGGQSFQLIRSDFGTQLSRLRGFRPPAGRPTVREGETIIHVARRASAGEPEPAAPAHLAPTADPLGLGDLAAAQVAPPAGDVPQSQPLRPLSTPNK